MKCSLRVLFGWLLPLALAAAAPGLIVEDDGPNSSAPTPTDPGWNNVGKRSAYAAVYIGSGWVLTAAHVGAGDVYFGGVPYPWVPGTAYQLTNPDSSPADLLMFRLYPPYPPYPVLPSLTISSTTPSNDAELIMIGHGYTIGDPTSWDPGPGPAINGYLWAGATGTRWGRNFVELPLSYDLDLGTHVFGSVFDGPGSGGTNHESQGAVGDSGGAGFAWNGSSYQLAGILVAIGTHPSGNQPPQTALYGNTTVFTDLATYRTKIVNQMPEPIGGAWAGAALVAALARRRLNVPSSPGSPRTSDRAR